MIAAKAAESVAKEKLTGHLKGSVNFRQRSQVKL
jgi:hypothetical protein